jgi:hypothetical protein
MSNSYKNTIPKGLCLEYGVMDCSNIGKNGLVRRKDIPKKLQKTSVKGFVTKIDEMRKKDFEGAPNRFWVHLRPKDAMLDVIKIYTLVYDEYIQNFKENVKISKMVHITNLDREVKGAKHTLFYSVIYRDRSFKVLTEQQFNAKRLNNSKKLIKLSVYLKKTRALSLNEINPYKMVRHAVKVSSGLIVAPSTVRQSGLLVPQERRKRARVH